MAPIRNLAATASLAVATFASLASASCETICRFGGHNTSCIERIEWVQAHVDNWNRVVKIPDADKKLTCKQSIDKVLTDCPVCKSCTSCFQKLRVGDLVSALYPAYNDEWHMGQISKVLAGGKYEVTLKNIPVIFPSTRMVKKAVEPPAARPSPPPALTNTIVAKYSDSWKFVDMKAYTPAVVVGGVIGGMSIVGLSVFVRKLKKHRQQSDHFTLVA